MEPLTAASSFATIVGLLCNFKQEHKERHDLTSRDFIAWLEDHRHQELKEFIIRTVELPSEIDKLLKQDTELILSKLSDMDDVLASLLSRIDGMAGIVHAIRPQSELSDQAIGILRQLAKSTSEEFGVIHAMGGVAHLSLIRGGQVDYKEVRFLKDDLDTLLNYGLLRFRMGSSGTEFYGLTRNGARLIESLDGKY